MKILIVDDEPLARDRLNRLINDGNMGEVVAEAANGQAAIDMVKQHNPELVLLDIRMPGIDGIETARQLSTLESPPAVIFVTAYDEYAINAFESQAVDYLLKPIRRERLEKSIRAASQPNRLQLQLLAQQVTKPAAKHISVKIHSGIRQIPLSEIYYFLAEHKYITVCYQNGDVLTEGSLKNIEAEFEDELIRIHRNALVAKNQLQGIRKEQTGQYFAELKDSNAKLEVSRRHVASVKQFLKA